MANGLFNTPLSPAPVLPAGTPITPSSNPAVTPPPPVSTQFIPKANTVPIAGIGANQYQQGYYMDVGDGYYTYFPPPGVSSFGQSFRRDQLPAGAIVAPPGTTRESVWGNTAGPEFAKNQTYPELQGTGGGLPGGYKVEAYVNSQGNVLHLTTLGGKVQGGVPAGYRKVGSEELPGTVQQKLQESQIAPTTRGHSPDAAAAGRGENASGSGVPGVPSTASSEISEAVSSVIEHSMEESFDHSLEGAVKLGAQAALAAHGLTPETSISMGAKAAISAVFGVGATPLSIASLVSRAATQPAQASAQAMAMRTMGIPNTIGAGNFSHGAVYGVDTPFGIMTVTDHPTLSVDQVHALDAVKFGFNPNSKDFNPENFKYNDTGFITGMTGTTDLIGFSSISNALGVPGAYDSSGNYVDSSGKIHAYGPMQAYNSLSAKNRSKVVNARKDTPLHMKPRPTEPPPVPHKVAQTPIVARKVAQTPIVTRRSPFQGHPRLPSQTSPVRYSEPHNMPPPPTPAQILRQRGKQRPRMPQVIAWTPPSRVTYSEPFNMPPPPTPAQIATAGEEAGPGDPSGIGGMGIGEAAGLGGEAGMSAMNKGGFISKKKKKSKRSKGLASMY